MPDEVQDARPRGWFWMDNEIITKYAATIGPYGVMVYAALVCMSNQQGADCHPSYQYLARLLHLSRPTIIKAIQKLKEARLVLVTPRQDEHGDQTSHIYTITEPGGGGKRRLPPSKRDLPPGKRDGPQVVKEIYHGGKRRLPKQDVLNKTHLNKRETPPVVSSAPPHDGGAPETPPPGGEGRAVKRTICPEDFQSSSQTRTGIERNYPQLNVDDLVHAMIHWSQAKGEQRASWNSELWTFARRAAHETPSARASPRHTVTTADHNLQSRQEANRLIERMHRHATERS